MKRKLLVSVAVCVIVAGSLLLAVTLAGPRPETNSALESGGGSAIRIDSMVNGEPIFKEDVVVWYAGHWTHDSFDTNSRFVGQGPFYNGPDIIIRK